jgi:hypothetical protein
MFQSNYIDGPVGFKEDPSLFLLMNFPNLFPIEVWMRHVFVLSVKVSGLWRSSSGVRCGCRSKSLLSCVMDLPSMKLALQIFRRSREVSALS